MELLFAQFLHSFAPGMIGGIAYIAFTIAVWETITFLKILAYMILSSLTGYIVYLFVSLFSSKIIIFLWISWDKETEILRAISWLGWFLWKQMIEWLIRFTPKYIDKYAQKWIQ